METLLTIREQRREILQLLKERPSLKPYLTEAIANAYEAGLDLVVKKTPLDYSDLPKNCPYTSEQLFDPEYVTPFRNSYRSRVASPRCPQRND
ncbi:DUF29 domain-containing protein [Thermosynechococcus vestitus]|uniref:Tsl2319 protein n=1 Tax=Thermosynechococcus vestitus (strain NIES-2133 / IAM M-273 / BP-1) TaxID=197221 RepID=Q8DGJ8_THEVB|nr:DUF29 domain-containing protein [Thermosynechococcus vestitus]BAC09871.1 tsl2319 [Thermosynechococcus vestitus BP-1]